MTGSWSSVSRQWPATDEMTDGTGDNADAIPWLVQHGGRDDGLFAPRSGVVQVRLDPALQAAPRRLADTDHSAFTNVIRDATRPVFAPPDQLRERPETARSLVPFWLQLSAVPADSGLVADVRICRLTCGNALSGPPSNALRALS